MLFLNWFPIFSHGNKYDGRNFQTLKKHTFWKHFLIYVHLSPQSFAFLKIGLHDNFYGRKIVCCAMNKIQTWENRKNGPALWTTLKKGGVGEGEPAGTRCLRERTNHRIQMLSESQAEQVTCKKCIRQTRKCERRPIRNGIQEPLRRDMKERQKVLWTLCVSHLGLNTEMFTNEMYDFWDSRKNNPRTLKHYWSRIEHARRGRWWRHGIYHTLSSASVNVWHVLQ